MIKISETKDHEFGIEGLKIYVEGTDPVSLGSSEASKVVYAHRHKIGASHMGLNSFHPTGKKDNVFHGYWLLLPGNGSF